MSLKAVLQKLKQNRRFGANIINCSYLGAREAQYAPFPNSLPPEIRGLLHKKGINKLYSHQAQAFELAAAGKDLTIVTPTASGKTLCYNLPVLNALLKDNSIRALYLFPTKALAQDQVNELMQWGKELGGLLKTYTYDGDTPADARRAIRSAGNIVVTNPDMLHTGILPHHTKWMRLFESLQFIVIDELHTYRGVFGSHVGNVLQRLERICSFYGSKPQFICTSATIANPQEHGENLTKRKMELISESGAPKGERALIFYNPPVVNHELGIRRSALLEAQSIATQLLKAKVPTIVFARSRVNTELLVTYLRKQFDKLGITDNAIRGYRGGYLPQQRREIERDLRAGKVLGVVSTNALELGIDIGSLEAAILCGYPGTIASTYQQIGRAGRGQKLSCAVLVANSSPLNQFIINNPQFFLEGSAEKALINTENLIILMSHLKCGAFELPFLEGEKFGGQDVTELLDFLADENILRKVGGRYHWMSENYPAHDISLRSAATDNFVIIDTTADARVIGEVDRFSAPMLIHEGAIYLHESQQYHIDKLDYGQEKAYARKVDSDYFTDANLAVDLKVLDVFEKKDLYLSQVAYGEVMVACKATIYKKIKFHTHENIGWGNISLPEQQMHTHAFWLAYRYQKEDWDKDTLQGALEGLANLMAQIAPLQLMCEPHDLGFSAQIKAPFTALPTVYIYEKYPGGVGFSEKLFAEREALLERVKEVLITCPCPKGCPSCVGPLAKEELDLKTKTKMLLDEVISDDV